MGTLSGLTPDTAAPFAELVASDGDGFILQLMGAMERQSEAAEQRVRENQEAQIRELRQDFVRLFDSVDRVARRLDSASLNSALDAWQWNRDFNSERLDAGNAD
jgi:hypothetical protein